MATENKNKILGDEQNPFYCFNEEYSGRSRRIGVLRRSVNDIEDVYQSNQVESEFLGKTLSNKRGFLLFIGILFGLFLLLGKSFYLQVIQGEYYEAMSQKNRVRIEYVKTTRGIIFDRTGRVLVRNMPSFLITITPSELPFEQEEKSSHIEKIAKTIDLKVDDVMNILQPIKKNSLHYYQPITLKDDVSYEEAIGLLTREPKLKGVAIETSITRAYLNKDALSLSHLLGYIGKVSEPELMGKNSNQYLLTDYTGKTGIERYYESDLRGAHGSKHIEVDAYGQQKKILKQKDRTVGSNIVLTVDLEMQRKLEELLRNQLTISKKKRASAIAMDPKTGEILALVSLPTFDNNMFSKKVPQESYAKLLEDSDNPLFFRSISGEYPSGSTFKMIVAAAALQEKVITKDTAVISSGGIRIGQWLFPDWKSGGHGRTDVKKALAESVNTFFYIVGGGYNGDDGLGVDRLANYATAFGLGQTMGVDLPGERAGFVPTKKWKVDVKKEPWYIGDTYHFAIGQGDLLVTPLQVASYTATIANGGTVYKPHIVKEIINPQENTLQSIEKKIIKDSFIDQKYIQIVQEGLRFGVTAGSARRLNSLPIKVAGKTGTAQWSLERSPHAWFTGYAPFDDPKIVISILIEEGEEGSRVAVPVAEEFLRWYYTNYMKI